MTVSYRLETLGTVVLKGAEFSIRAAEHRHQRRRLALLAALASQGERGVSRDQLLLLFWPDSTQKKARHSLDQQLYAIRSSLGESIFLGTNPIRLNPGSIESDVGDFLRHLANGDLQAAVAVYRGPFLEGFYLSDTLEFEDWAESERRRLAHAYEGALEQLAREAESRRDHSQAIRWRRKLAEADPVSTRHAIALMQAFVNAGDVAEAIAFGMRYQGEVAEQIGTESLASVRELVSGLKTHANAQPVSLNPADVPREADPVAVKAPRRTSHWIYAAMAAIAVLALAAKMLPRDDARLNAGTAMRGTTNVAAYDLYMTARNQVMMRNDSTSQIAVDYLTKAVELDPEFAAAHAFLAGMYARLSMSDDPPFPRAELKRRAIASITKAIALDGSIAEAHMAAGFIDTCFLIDFQRAERELKRALALDAREPYSRELLSLTYVYLGRLGDALAVMREAIAVDPLSPTARATLANLQYIDGRCDLAMPALDSLASMHPPLRRVAVTRSLCYGAMGRWDDAAAIARNETGGNGRGRLAGLLGLSLARAGKRSEAMAVRSTLREMARSNEAANYDAAIVSYGLGDMSSAFAELKRAVDADFLQPEIMGAVFDDLRKDPRFANIVASKGVRPIR